MSRRLAVALATLAAGVGLLTAAMLGTAAAAPPTPGIFKAGTTGNLDAIDPAIAYGTTSWWLEYATGAWLYNYREDGSYGLKAEIAKRYTVSKDGREYRFYLRRGYRFSDGKPVTAASFAYAIRRAKDRALGSPAGPFVTDRNRVDIVGVRAKSLVLTIRLRKPAPQLLTVLAMPFFQAASSTLPLQTEVRSVSRVGELPTAGPYTWSFHDPNHQADIVRNPYYRGPRAHHVPGVELDMSLASDDCYQRTIAGDLDLGCVPPNQVENVAATYGVSRTKPIKTGRFWVKAGDCLSWLGINHSRALFHDNPSLRKALNWAVDRTAFGGVPPLGTPWTHLLPPPVPGSITARRLQPYPIRGDLDKARQLAAGNLRDGNIHVAYQSAGTVGPRQAQLVRQTLIDLGFDQSRIEMTGFSGFDLFQAIGTPGAPYDLAVGIGICADSGDAADFLAFFLEQGDWSPDNPVYRKMLESISSRLKGKARLAALGRFDLELMRKVAPVVPLATSSDRSFFSARVNPKSLVYTRYGWSIPALRFK
jgi:ABC-type transport system substrate-binding protein